MKESNQVTCLRRELKDEIDDFDEEGEKAEVGVCVGGEDGWVLGYGYNELHDKGRSTGAA